MKDWDTYDKMVLDRVLKRGDSVVGAGLMFDYELVWAEDLNTRWYRSKNAYATGYSSYSSYLLNKKWTLEEEFNNHLLMFQQVRVSANHFIKVHYYIPDWIGDR